MTHQINVTRAKIEKIEQLDDFEDEYVYDIGVDDETPYFFANNILVHNSSYFSAYNVWMDKPEYKDFEFTRDNIVTLYDGIADETNASFPGYMNDSFNTGITRGSIIAAGRELVGSRGLFIKKKKYAILVYELDGFRLDVKGKPGKLKVMGLDLKRSDTPQYMQDFLEKVLMATLTGETKDAIFEMIKQFRREFHDRPGWEKGTPKKINGLTDKTNQQRALSNIGKTDIFDLKSGEKGKVNMAGHVSAAMNYMKLRKMHNDLFAMELTDGSKAIVCKLKPNPLGMTSIAIPTDENHIPQWFKELPFDHSAMEETIIDYKLDNLLGVLGWDLALANDALVNDLFSW